MSKICAYIEDLEGVITKLNALRDGLKQMKADSEAVEKARENLRGRRRSKKDGEPG